MWLGRLHSARLGCLWLVAGSHWFGGFPYVEKLIFRVSANAMDRGERVPKKKHTPRTKSSLSSLLRLGSILRTTNGTHQVFGRVARSLKDRLVCFLLASLEKKNTTGVYTRHTHMQPERDPQRFHVCLGVQVHFPAPLKRPYQMKPNTSIKRILI